MKLSRLRLTLLGIAGFVISTSTASATTLLDTIGNLTYNLSPPAWEFNGWQELAVPFSTASAVTATYVKAYAWNSGQVEFGVMADASGLPSGSFLYGADTLTSQSAPAILSSLNWSLAANSNYWLVGVLVDPVISYGGGVIGTTTGLWQQSNVSGAFAFTNYQLSQFSWRPADDYVPAVYVGTSAPTNSGGSVVTSVPEPTTWALIILGFAALGLARYRRTRRKDEAAWTAA